MTAAQSGQRRFTVLGCGSSPGVPRITGDWGACDPQNPKNRRRRASLLIEQIAPNGGKTTVVIDTGPDFREQMISARVENLDAVVLTHAHADHIHGLDDLRGYFYARNGRVPMYADAITLARVTEAFRYCIETPPGSNYPPIVRPMLIETPDSALTISGAGGDITLMPLLQQHGDIQSLGFRIGDFAYCSDVSAFPEETVAKLGNLDVLVIDALQYRPHPSHYSLSEALEWIERLKPKRAVLTHMHIPMDYASVMAETPDHVEPAYDGLVIETPVSASL
ncbi:MAG: MBL fold metallo-hydrolase [Proteobacteria bacterium]|nr:MBL fold metallo-hydrolase [Pseudomonadota bacterium]